MQDQSPRSPADRKAGRGFIVLANSLKMNEYHVTVEEVVVHATQVKAATPEEFSDALEKMGKTRHILANSGCLNHCPARSYHDNLVAHEAGIAGMDNAIPFRGLCADWLSKDENRRMILSHLNLIRPEDLCHYGELCDSFKLATRVSPDPVFILESYVAGACHGNLLDLTEPNHAGHFYPIVLENDKIPPEYGLYAASCAKKCHICGYCGRVFDAAARSLEDVFVASADCQ